jgi:hypothetical protein
MNRHHTFVWPRYENKEEFHSHMLPFYLDEDAFNKEVMLWLGVKRNPHKLGMHYVLPTDMLKKRGQEEGVGSSSGLEVQKKESLKQMESNEEEERQPLEQKKRILAMFPQLLELAMLIGKDVNEILIITFIIGLVTKKLGTRISSSKVLNPNPISSTIPRTLSVTRATHIIDIQDNPKPETTPSTTIITKKPSSTKQP